MPELQKLNLSGSNPTPAQAPVQQQTSSASVRRSEPRSGGQSNIFGPVFLVVALILGVGTGYIAFKTTAKTNTQTTATMGTQIPSGSALKVGDVFGTADEKTFKDSAEGVLVKGGVGGEGSHHLVRPGGDSQNVYLTSSVVDLDQVVGHKIKVWGQTMAARKAGWLMDVGRVQIEELNAQVPGNQ